MGSVWCCIYNSRTLVICKYNYACLMYKGPKVSLRSLSLSKGLRLKIAIVGAVVTVITVAGVLTGISLAQQTQPNSIGFKDAPAPYDGAPAFLEAYSVVVNEGTKSFTSTVVTTSGDVPQATTVTVTVGILDGTLPMGQ